MPTQNLDQALLDKPEGPTWEMPGRTERREKYAVPLWKKGDMLEQDLTALRQRLEAIEERRKRARPLTEIKQARRFLNVTRGMESPHQEIKQCKQDQMELAERCDVFVQECEQFMQSYVVPHKSLELKKSIMSESSDPNPLKECHLERLRATECTHQHSLRSPEERRKPTRLIDQMLDQSSSKERVNATDRSTRSSGVTAQATNRSKQKASVEVGHGIPQVELPVKMEIPDDDNSASCSRTVAAKGMALSAGHEGVILETIQINHPYDFTHTPKNMPLREQGGSNMGSICTLFHSSMEKSPTEGMRNSRELYTHSPEVTEEFRQERGVAREESVKPEPSMMSGNADSNAQKGCRPESPMATRGNYQYPLRASEVKKEPPDVCCSSGSSRSNPPYMILRSGVKKTFTEGVANTKNHYTRGSRVTGQAAKRLKQELSANVDRETQPLKLTIGKVSNDYYCSSFFSPRRAGPPAECNDLESSVASPAKMARW